MRLPVWLRIKPVYLILVIALGLAAILYTVLIFTPANTPPSIEATKIRPDPEKTGLTYEGAFSGVFYNFAGSPIKVKNVQVVDANDTSLRCNSNKEVDVPQGGSFEASLVGCGQRPKGGDFSVKVRIDYDMIDAGVATSQNEFGDLSGPLK
jgi:hypothetical protein